MALIKECSILFSQGLNLVAEAGLELTTSTRGGQDYRCTPLSHSLLIKPSHHPQADGSGAS